MNNALDRRITPASLLKFTAPSIIMMIVMSLYTVVDGIFVARFVNTDAFSSINIMYPLLSVVIAVGTMFGTGATAIVSRKLGEGRRQEACENMSFVLLVSVVVGLVISVLAFVFLDQIIPLLGANDALFPYCRAYMLPLIFFLPANILQSQFHSLFVASGRPNIGLAVTILGGLANVVLDYVFVALFRWGISGAAIATGIGYLIPACYGLYFFARNKNSNLRLARPKRDWRMLRDAMTNGASEMVTNLSGCVTTFLFNILMMRLVGQDGVAAISIILYLDFVLIAICLGYSIGVAPLISYNYGCGNREKLQKLFGLSNALSVGTSLSLTVIAIVFAPQLAGIFTPPGSAVYDMATTGLRIYALGYVFKSCNVFASALFTAFGNGQVSALLSFLRTLVFLVASLLGLTALFGLNGIWWATPLAELVAFALSVFYILRYRKTYHYW